MDYDLVILGAGAAGMMGAVAAGERAAELGKPLRIAVLEKNVRPGIKVLVCGGGRCNFTNAGSVEFLIEQFGRNGRFLSPALRHMDNETLRGWFTGQGVPSHEEHDGKIYPDSNQAKSVVDALLRRMKELGADVFAGAGWAAATVEKRESGFQVVTVDGHEFSTRVVMLAVGGMSYQRMGTTGDGYRMAEALGHAVVTPRPAIVGLLCKEEWPREMPGTAVTDVEVRIEVSGPLPRLATGKPTPSVNDVLFTHFGLSGPAVLNLSEIVAELLEKFEAVTVRVDFQRKVSHAQLGELFRGWQQRHGKKLVRKMLAGEETRNAKRETRNDDAWAGLPIRLAEMFCKLEEIPAEQPCATLTSGQIHRLVERVKSSRFTIYETRGFKEAMVTAGGVALPEVDPQTYESKLVPGLYITGEVLDLTGPSGGYNLQLAFSTGHLAGTRAAEQLCG